MTWSSSYPLYNVLTLYLIYEYRSLVCLNACHFPSILRTYNSATSPATVGTILLATILSLSIQSTVCSTFVNTSHFLVLPALCVLLVVSGGNPPLNGPPLPASLCNSHREHSLLHAWGWGLLCVKSVGQRNQKHLLTQHVYKYIIQYVCIHILGVECQYSIYTYEKHTNSSPSFHDTFCSQPVCECGVAVS